MNGFIPIIAHVERYKATRNDIGFFDRAEGYGSTYPRSTQISISGQDGLRGKKPLHGKVMKHGLLDFVGSERTP